MVLESFHMGLADGPTEVHKITLARQLLAECKANDDLFPTMHLPRLRAHAHEKYGDILAALSGEPAYG
jgi:acyl-CoA dehydrogenase